MSNVPYYDRIKIANGSSNVEGPYSPQNQCERSNGDQNYVKIWLVAGCRCMQNGQLQSIWKALEVDVQQ